MTKKTKTPKELYKQSETITIQRSQINFAPFNPKRHTDEQIAQMRKNIKNVGFLGGIIWNEQTSNLVDGHKRVMSLDIIHKYDGTPTTDYPIKVEKVSFDLKTEKEQNIFQTRSRTELDEELMRSLIPDIDYLNAGLDDYDLNLKEAIKQQAIEKAQNLDAYVTLSFDNWKNKKDFMLRMGFDPEFKMIKGETLSAKVERID